MSEKIISDDYEMNWYEDEARIVIRNASEDLLDAAVFTAEGLAKTDPNIPVDTGFMRNAIYGISSKRSGRSAARSAAKAVAERPMAPVTKIGASEAALHAAAEYSIFQEMKHSFIYRALEKTAKQFGGLVQKVRRKHFD